MILRSKTPFRPAPDDGRVARLELEAALDTAELRERTVGERIRRAAAKVGGELVLTLPGEGAEDMTAIVRLRDGPVTRLFQLRTTGGAVTVQEEAQADPLLVSFARSALALLERLRGDRAMIAVLDAG